LPIKVFAQRFRLCSQLNQIDSNTSDYSGVSSDDSKSNISDVDYDSNNSDNYDLKKYYKVNRKGNR